jgi:amino acid transporter
MASLFSPHAHINQWQIELLDLGWVERGLELRINLVSIIATGFLSITFVLQHHGAARAARAQKVLAVVTLAPLIFVGVVPFVTGDLPHDRLFPLLPLIRDAAGHAALGTWNAVSVTALMGAMFGAAWSTYGFEGAVCYTREFKNPGSDTYKAIVSAGLLCILVFSLVPLSFQVSLGLDRILDPSIYDGTGVALALASIVKGGILVSNLIVVMLILSLLTWLASRYVVPAFGVDGVILFFGHPSFVAILGALMLPRKVATKGSTPNSTVSLPLPPPPANIAAAYSGPNTGPHAPLHTPRHRLRFHGLWRGSTSAPMQTARTTCR